MYKSEQLNIFQSGTIFSTPAHASSGVIVVTELSYVHQPAFTICAPRLFCQHCNQKVSLLPMLCAGCRRDQGQVSGHCGSRP